MIKMKVGIIGGSDGLGKTLIYFLRDDFDVIISARDHKKGRTIANELGIEYIESNTQLAEMCDVVIVSVPIHFTPDVIREVAPFMRKEIPSQTMKESLPDDVEYLPTHPIFGPRTTELDNQVIVLTPDKKGKWFDRIYSYLDSKNMRIIEDNNNEINELINKDSYNRLIGKLNENEKEIISLKILSNLSFKEIAKLLNKPTGTIKWIYYKSINTLKLLLSNLAMFIISFISSCFAMKNRKKLSPKLNVNESNQTKEEIKDEITEDKELLQDNKKSTITNDKSSQMQESVIEEVPNISNNYLSISLIGVSTIFFILTIIFSIIFTKHQLKRRKKLSKK